jgi:hypothetical protein
MSPQNIEDFGKLRYSTILGAGNDVGGVGSRVDRADLTTSARNNLIAGLSIVGQATSFGVIPFEWSIFTEPVEGSDPLVSGDPGAPAAPLQSSVLYANQNEGAAITSGATGLSTSLTAGAIVSVYKRVAGSVASVSSPNSALYYRRGLAPGQAVTATDRDGSTGGAQTGLAANTAGTAQDETIICHNVSMILQASKQDATWEAGTTGVKQFYWYRASAVNDIGESAASYVSTGGVSPDKTMTVKFLIPRVENGARAYRIYRYTSSSETVAPALSSSTVGVGTAGWQFVGYVADPDAGEWVEFTDSNGASSDYTNFRPGTNIAPLLCRNSADLCIAQMSPLLKMPLAPTSTTFEYLLLLYHTLVLKAPERQFIFKNVGKLN